MIRVAMRTVMILAMAATMANTAGVAQEQFRIYGVLGIDAEDVMTGTLLSGEVMPGGEKHTVVIVTYFTGKKERSDAVNVRLTVLRGVAGAETIVYDRDIGKERGGFVGRGEVELFDFDRDGLKEIVFSYDDHGDKLIAVRMGEILIWKDGRFDAAWSDVLSYDATRDARQVPAERRDHWKREIDYRETMRTKGITLFMNRKVMAVAGETLPQPKIIQEMFPLMPRPEEP